MLMFGGLRYPTAAVDATFRLIALIALLPIVVLTLVDLLGWLTFKLISRPLGYTST